MGSSVHRGRGVFHFSQRLIRNKPRNLVEKTSALLVPVRKKIGAFESADSEFKSFVPSN